MFSPVLVSASLKTQTNTVIFVSTYFPKSSMSEYFASSLSVFESFKIFATLKNADSMSKRSLGSYCREMRLVSYISDEKLEYIFPLEFYYECCPGSNLFIVRIESYFRYSMVKWDCVGMFEVLTTQMILFWEKAFEIPNSWLRTTYVHTL